MQIDGHDIGVCSWSLRPTDLNDLIAKVRKVGVTHVQLALSGFIAASEPARAQMLATIRDSGLTLTATMINFEGEDYTTIASIRRTGGYVPDEQWPRRCQQTVQAADISKALGVTRLSTHVGFVPMSSDPNYDVMVRRVGEIAGELSSRGVSLIMETGQESASELLQFVNDLTCRNVGINFDPANMILYGA
ncbi:MAG TPA: TIM barrel protein, partial [Tepidisphaeraceae bacterium]|nr:TIM barrel protein [Tepidisphaeraceae bacterium]